jgi:DNA-binding XRE family transcriptional regulator
MLAVVKKPHTDKTLFEIKGDIPRKILDYIDLEYGAQLEIIKENQEDHIRIIDTDWFKKIRASITPGEIIKIHRENLGLTQSELGKKLGLFSAQKISDMEKGRRKISKEVAKKLSKIFEVPIERFL